MLKSPFPSKIGFERLEGSTVMAEIESYREHTQKEVAEEGQSSRHPIFKSRKWASSSQATADVRTEGCSMMLVGMAIADVCPMAANSCRMEYRLVGGTVVLGCHV